MSTPSISNGVLYVGSDDFNLYALDVNTGAVKWKGATGSDIWSDPIEAEGTSFVGSQDGGFYAFCA
jgi:outer membrane protein assembly factor BamB